jgi:hypothetical protein
MSYSVIDPTIQTWAQRHGLSLFTQYKDSEVRSVDVVEKSGRKFQIWIDRPKGDRVSVHAWDYKKRRQDWDASIADLDNFLEEAIRTVRSWA